MSKTENKNYMINLKEVTLDQGPEKGMVKYPLLEVEISGSPNIGKVSEIMKEIQSVTSDITEEYISVTDFRRLDISNFFRKILFSGMEVAYKYLLSVDNPAVLSFVVLPAGQQMSTAMKEKLETINSAEEHPQKYNYVFVSDPKVIPEIAAKILAEQ